MDGKIFWDNLHPQVVKGIKNTTTEFKDNFKVFHDKLGLTMQEGVTGAVVIRTEKPFTDRMMISLIIRGFNYKEDINTINLNVGYYAFQINADPQQGPNFAQTGFVNLGDHAIKRIRGARDVNGNHVLVIGDTDHVWNHPKIWIESAMFGFSKAPDDYMDSWTMGITEDISDLEIMKEFPNTSPSTDTIIPKVVDDLTTGGASDALSAEQGVMLKGLVDANTSSMSDNKGRLDTLDQDLLNATGIIDSHINKKATDLQLGHVMVDGETIKSNPDGTIYAVPALNSDGVTIISEDSKLKAVNIKGLNVSPTLINEYLTGTSSNIQNQINEIKVNLTNALSGVDYLGRFENYAEVDAIVTKKNGDMVVVVADETKEGKRTLYIYNDSLIMWQFIGAFDIGAGSQFADNFLELLDTPENYTGASGKNVVVNTAGTGLEFADADYSKLVNKPNSTTTAIDNAVNDSHTHTNKVGLDRLGVNAESHITVDGIDYVANLTNTTLSSAKSYTDTRLATHDDTNASKTAKGHVRIGDGLSVSNGIVSLERTANQGFDVYTPISQYPLGTTETPIISSSSNKNYADMRNLLNITLGYSLGEGVMFRFYAKTIKRTDTAARQVVSVVSNLTSSAGHEMFKLERDTNYADGVFYPWRVSVTTMTGSGDPNNIISAMRGCLYYDYIGGKLYRKNTGTTGGIATGWVILQ